MLDANVRENLVNEMMKVLIHYRWNPKRPAIEKIIDTWYERKEQQINLFSQLPNWQQDKFMVIFSNDYTRPMDRSTSLEILNDIYHEIKGNIDKYVEVDEKRKSIIFDEQDAEDAKNQISTIIRLFRSYPEIDVICGYKRENLKELNKLYSYYDELYCKISMIPKFDKEKYEIYNIVKKAIYYLYTEINNDRLDNLLTQDHADTLNSYMTSVGLNSTFKAGQKFMRALRKFLILINFDLKYDSYNSCIVRLGDAVNPLHYTRHTVISFNPIDYLRSSMGSSWSSCHTIDRDNVDKRSGSSYRGMHAKGVMSYMLDSVTGVMYTVDAKYDGNEFELQDKITRQLYHFGTPDNPFFIQGRLYPQSNDCGAKALYKQTREIMQDILSKIWKVNNLWATPITACENENYFYSKGSHYRDYKEFSMCKISILKGAKICNLKPIVIGADEICIECGDYNHNSDNELSCCSDFESMHKCYECGYETETDNLIEIDGHYYCEDCYFFCEYHQRYEVRSDVGHNYVQNYGYVCDDSLDDAEKFIQCERCGNIVLTNNVIKTEDGHNYCDCICASRAGYFEGDDGVYRMRDAEGRTA